MIDSTSQILSPRIAHNRAELDKFLAKHNIKSQWPAVSEQLPSVKVEGLFNQSYNPSIIRFQGKLLIVYRFHFDESAKTKLAIAELDEKFNVIWNQELSLNDDNSCEDARLFEFKGELWMNYVSSTWPEFPACTVKYVSLSKPDHWRCSNPTEYPWKDRQTMDKNHVPFPRGDKVHIIYQHHPNQIVYTINSSEVYTADSLRWPYGIIRGGTVPIAYDGKLLRFFHSRLENEMPPTRWRYTIGAMLMETGPSFKMLFVSKRPILRGSEIGGNPEARYFKKNVCIPYGAIEKDGHFIVSIGVNDSESRLITIKEENLNL